MPYEHVSNGQGRSIPWRRCEDIAALGQGGPSQARTHIHRQAYVFQGDAGFVYAARRASGGADACRLLPGVECGTEARFEKSAAGAGRFLCRPRRGECRICRGGWWWSQSQASEIRNTDGPHRGTASLAPDYRPQRSPSAVGFPWFERFCAEHGTEFLVLNNEQLSPEQEMAHARSLGRRSLQVQRWERQGDPMPDEEFRRVEGILDGLVRKDEERLRSAGLHVEDHSNRRYYKNDPLSWCYQFKREWIVDGEIARVTVSLCHQQSISEYYGQAPPEQEPPVIELTWDAEQFQ